MFYIEGREGQLFETLAEAAQEAEFLHAEDDVRRTVLRDGDGAECYVSEGAPE